MWHWAGIRRLDFGYDQNGCPSGPGTVQTIGQGYSWNPSAYNWYAQKYAHLHLLINRMQIP